MRISYVAATLGTFGLLVSGVWLGCSSSDNAAANPGGGSDASVDHFVPLQGDAGPGADASPPSGDSGPAPDGGPALSCAAYCTAIQAACGAADGGPGGTAQYYDINDCMSTCALFPIGTYGDTANTLGCRQYHATLAATGPAAHCPHAGAGGGALCGQRCEDYCFLTMAHCSAANGANPPYLTSGDCLAACNAYPYDTDAGDYDELALSTLNCLDYHLRESFSDLAGQGIDGGHCDDLSIDGGTVRGACHP